MKKILLLTLTLLTFSFIWAQDCSYYPMKKGTMLKYESYNSKDKLESSSKTELLSVSQSGNKTTATAEITSFDKKGKETYKTEVPIVCDNGELIIDMKSMIPEETLEGFKDMDVNIETDNLIIPQNTTPGQKLNDGHMSISVSTNGMSIGTFRFDITNREVIGTEQISVDGKPHTALKISYDFDTKVMIMNKQYKVTDWYVEGLGVVKSVTYKSDGKSIVSYTILKEYILK